jgi:hypothetical protein
LVSKKGEKTNVSKLEEIQVKPNKEAKKLSPEQRLKQTSVDVSLKVCKELVKSYENSDAQRKFGEESTKVFEFSHNIISIFLNDFYILFVHS